jgi:hypothetical protein
MREERLETELFAILTDDALDSEDTPDASEMELTLLLRVLFGGDNQENLLSDLPSL